VDTLVDRPSAYARLAENLGLVLRNAAYLLNLLRAHQAPPHAQPGAAMHNIAPRRCSCSLSCLPGSVMTVARHRFHVLCMLALRQDTGCSASSASAAQRLLPGRWSAAALRQARATLEHVLEVERDDRRAALRELRCAARPSRTIRRPLS